MINKTIHEMKLKDSPFSLIKQGIKTVELRLNDDKRKLLKEGDYIKFTNLETQEQIIVKITKLFVFPSFKELYKHYNPIEMGYNHNDIVDYRDMEKYYSLEEQRLHKVLAIEINLKSEQ